MNGDQASLIHTIEQRIHCLCRADNGNDTIQCRLNLTKHQNRSSHNHKVYQHNGITGLHIGTELLQKLCQDIPASCGRVSHKDQRHADSHENPAKPAGDQPVALILPDSGHRYQVLDHTHPDNGSDGFKGHGAV